MQSLLKQWYYFLTAMMFYSRIPIAEIPDFKDEYISRASRFFPLVGWIVGIISTTVLFLASFFFGSNVSVSLLLLASVLATGAFHEDGLADAADGFGGGWTKERILEIMKDSRIGTYGTIALILLFLLKFNGLQSLINLGFKSKMQLF